MAGRFETPPSLQGKPEQQLGQLGRYLFRLSEKLNVEERAQSDGDNLALLAALRSERQGRAAADMALNKSICELRAQIETLSAGISALSGAVCADGQGNVGITGTLTLGAVTLTESRLQSLLNNLE